MMFHKIKKQLRLVFFLSIAGFFAVIFFYAKLHGSTFQAAVLRGVTKVKLTVALNPKPTVLLPVKFDKQDHALSCEVATLKMLLAYRGINVEEQELIEKVGFDPTPKSKGNAGLIWGNPQEAFVGNINGKMLVDGYGVYWKPIGRVASEYRKSAVFENWLESDLMRELVAQNPVIVWGYLGSGKSIEWKIPEGGLIRAIFYEHTFVVNGFSGSPEKPDGFYVVDPLYGQVYFSRETFLKKWGVFGRSGVIVY